MSTGIRSEPYAVEISPSVRLAADLWRPPSPVGLVIFAHGSGSSRLSERNRYVSELLHRVGLGTLLMDLTTAEENRDRRARFEIEALGDRVVAAIDQLRADPDVAEPLMLFGASNGAAAAISAAAARPDSIAAIVSRGGRPDLAENALESLRTPTLLIVGGDDDHVLERNQATLPLLPEGSALEVIDGASHLFEEPGALDEVAELAGGWFLRHLAADTTA